MTLSARQKIERRHLERLAIVYLRQSSPRQVRENVRSTERQYALAERAGELGWQPERILTVDGDLGVSGRDTHGRDSYKQLVSRVCQSEVGAIFGLEVARLARSNAELLRLLEFCALTDTLVVDTDGIYDLQDFNDRMILGLKAQWSEAELHIMASRLQGAKRAAAERGELRLPLPVGYLYDDDGRVTLDPDEEIQAAVAGLFAAFEQTGSAFGVVGALKGQRFPKRSWGARAGELGWGRLTYARACDVLTNPCYAGAYVFGRHRSRRTVRPDGTIVTRTVELPRSQWAVLIRDHHPGYITWEQLLANERRLAANNTRRGQRPAREGSALCQGIVRCGGCGRAMETQYQRAGAAYKCSRSRIEHLATPRCRQVKAQIIDELVTERLLQALAPEEIALALAAADEVQARREHSNRALELRVERARYDAIRAERAFHCCEPENRLVARSLEARWEERLRELQDAQAQLAEHATPPAEPSRAQIEALARDLPALRGADTTADKDRKRLLRAIVADITITIDPDSDQLQLGIRWRSGAAEQHTISRPQRETIAPATLKLIARLAQDHSNTEIAAKLQAADIRTPRGRPFDRGNVSSVRCRYKIPSGPVRRDEELTPSEIAQRLGISKNAVYYWIRHGQLEARRGAAGRLSIPYGPEIEQELRQRVANSGHFKTQHRQTGGAV